MMRDAREEQGFAPEQVEALMPYGRESSLQTGDLLFDEKSVVDSFYVVLEGEVEISRLDGAAEIPIGTHGPGEFTGGLVVLTGRTSIHRGRGQARRAAFWRSTRRLSGACPSRSLTWPTSSSRAWPGACATRSGPTASGRSSRPWASSRPAWPTSSTIPRPRRGGPPKSWARQSSRPSSPPSTHDERFSAKEREALVALQRETAAGNAALLDPLSLGDAEDQLADWLGERGCQEPWDMAPALAEAGLDTDRLEAMAGAFDDRSLACGLEWLAGTLDLLGLASEIETSTGRISELVGAMKEYTYMDRAVVGEVDVISGLQNTITILGPRLKDVSLSREYEKDLPGIPGRGGELNQVWTNLIDNAIDAVDGRGSITIRAYVEGDRVVVEVVDDGRGIPREAQVHVFEPFYTTKDIGAGTGLGLDIVRRIVTGHGGEVFVQSEPGETCFTVRLPLDTTQNGG